VVTADSECRGGLIRLKDFLRDRGRQNSSAIERKPWRATIGKIGRLEEKYSPVSNDTESDRFPEPTMLTLPLNRRIQKHVRTDSVAFAVSGMIRPKNNDPDKSDGSSNMVEFKKRIESSTYLSPFKNFEPHQGEVEIRWDPLTGLTSRVVRFPTRRLERPDLGQAVSLSAAAKCPFCAENIGAMTARLDSRVFGCERLQHEGVTVIPNLISFDKYALVAIISKEHYLTMRDLADKGVLMKGIKALIEGFRRIRMGDGRVRFFSINCNYMPMSGGSIVHPHMQGIAGEYPTNFHRMTVEGSKSFFQRNRTPFWKALMEEEKRLGERFVSDAGNVFWYTPFAPKGTMDVAWSLSGPSLFSLSDDEWAEFGRGLGKVLCYFDDENIAGFNLSFFTAEEDEAHFLANGRIIARRFLPPANAADVNYLEKIHMESVCLLSPEEVARRLRERW
jgi:galactose-1-phosphate uridylyltransferase